MRPLFSCVIPVKGERPFMKDALASLAAQGMGDDLEIIVQDADVEPDCGQSDALNKGFAKAKGEWLFWLNADDVLLHGALRAVKRCLEVWKFGSLDWIAGNMMYIDAEGKVIDCRWDRGWKCAFDGLPVQVYGPSSFFRRELWDKCGGFDTSLRVCMDVDLWMKFREHGHWFKRLPQYVWGFRRHDGSLTKSRTKSPEEQMRQDAEVQLVHARHGVKVTCWRLWRARVIRLLNGSYLKGLVDTVRFRGLEVWRFRGLEAWRFRGLKV